MRSSALFTRCTHGFDVLCADRTASDPVESFNVAGCEADSGGKKIQLDQNVNQNKGTDFSSEDVVRGGVRWAIIKESALYRLAGIFFGSALLVASLGLGLPRHALARIASLSPAESSSTLINEEDTEIDMTEKNIDNALDDSEFESASAPAQSMEEEVDPAELVLLSFLKRHPEDIKALEGLMYIRLRKGSVAKALEIVDDLLALRPDHAPWQLVRAQALEFLGDLKAARHAFEKVLEKDPLSARALQGLATVMSKAGEGEEMLEMLRRAVQTATQTGKTRECKNLRMVLGQMYTVQGNFQEALELYKELEKEDPKDFRPYLCQGVIYSLLEDKVKADTAFLKYRRRCPKTFPERGYLDDLMIGAKTEARKALIVEKLKPPKGKKQPKPLRQPIIETGVTQNPMSEELELDQD